MHIIVNFKDRILSEYANRLEQMAGSGTGNLAQALNEGGAAVREQTVAAETAQTGLPGDTLERAQQEIPATAGSLTYTIRSKGGNVRLKYFSPSEGAGGVTAYPWGSAHFYPSAFATSGRPGARFAVGKLNGQVYRRVNLGDRGWKRTEPWRKKPHESPIQQERSGLFIPTEMTRGQTASAFKSGSATVLANVIVKRLGALLP